MLAVTIPDTVSVIVSDVPFGSVFAVTVPIDNVNPEPSVVVRSVVVTSISSE